MLKNKVLMFLFGAILFSLTACEEASEWSESDAWFQTNQVVDSQKADVFYLVSTDVMISPEVDGVKTYRSALLPEDLENIDREISYVQNNMFGEEFNFFSPHYHQFTFDLIAREDRFDEVFKDVTLEVKDAFRYYMDNLNGGRPFIIAGFSQGAMLTIELVKDLTEEELSRMVAAYVIGYRLDREDLTTPNIVPAKNAEDTGVTVSFNSVCSTDAIWPLVAEGSVTCINPISWTTDPVPVSFEYKEDVLSVQVDTSYNVLVVSNIDPQKYYFGGSGMPYPIGNLHHYDLLFYAGSIKNNAEFRAYGKEK